jgi:hypothetical protein
LKLTETSLPLANLTLLNELGKSQRGLNEATSGNKKAPLQKRCCPKTKLHIPSFPSTGGIDISIYALEAFQPTVCLPWIFFRQDSSERAII